MTRDTGAPDPQALRQQIQNWLMEEAWSVRTEAAPDMTWVIAGQDPAGRHIVVGQKRTNPDQILINGAVIVSDVHKPQLASLSKEALEDFLWELRFGLLSIDVEFDMVGEPPERFAIAQRVYYDGLTKDTFLQRISQVRKGVLFVIWMFARKFQQGPAKRELGFRAG